MENENQITYREKETAKALKMAILFSEPHFSEIVEILNDLGNIEDLQEREKIAELKKSQFFEAFKGTKIEEKEQLWLWNYLKHYDPKLSANPVW